MNSRKLFIISFCLQCLTLISFAQDIRTIETKVADLLAQLPATDIQTTNKLMSDMISLGDAGIKQICDQVIPLGSGDDIRPRFAVESLSRYLSQYGKESEKAKWEQVCISYATNRKDNDVKDFYMKQLQLVGTNASIDAMKVYFKDENLSSPALAVVSSVGGTLAEKVLSDALKDKKLPCAAAAMNTLAAMQSDIAVNEFIAWYLNSDKGIQASALNALAQTGSPLALPVLLKAAKSVSYKWEQTGATASLLVYAKAVGAKGDVKTMDKICKTIITNCNDRNSIQYKTSALETLVSYYGYEAMPYLIDAVRHPDKTYRNAAYRFSLSLAGTPVTRKWIEYYPEASPSAKPEIIYMLGIRKDNLALHLVSASLSDGDVNVRKEAAAAIVKINGITAIPSLIDYMIKFTGSEDQESAKSALVTILDNRRMPLLISALNAGPDATKKSAIELFAWGRAQEYFAAVLPFTAYSEENVKTAAYKALSDLAGPDDQGKLMQLLDNTDNPVLISNVQLALANAANQVSEPEMRSSTLLKSLITNRHKDRIIPILSGTGGREALATVLKEFDNGDSQVRDVCFKALTSWKDYSASSALYDICASGNKTFEGPAFDGYVKQVKSAPVTDDQKLLLFRKIMPFATSADRKIKIINETGKLRTYQSLLFTAQYLDDPSTCEAAAVAVMSIGLPDIDSKAGVYGANVRDILSKAITHMKGSESEYNKELISKYLQSMPQDDGFVPVFNGKDYYLTPEEKSAGFVALFNGRNLNGWVGDTLAYGVEDGMIITRPSKGTIGNLYTAKEFADFNIRFEFQLTPAANNGLGIRAPLTGDAAYVGMELQILDNTAPVYARLHPYQYHGSVYGVIPAKTGYLKPLGEWNYEDVYVKGSKVKVTLNGTVIVDGDISGPRENGTMDHKEHPGLKNKTGHIGFLGHGSLVKFRNIRINDLSQ